MYPTPFRGMLTKGEVPQPREGAKLWGAMLWAQTKARVPSRCGQVELSKSIAGKQRGVPGTGELLKPPFPVLPTVPISTRN